MRMKNLVLLTLGLGIATAALAHDGVKNAGVMARMDAMSMSKSAIGVLGDMASGKTAFDATKAAQAKSDLQFVAAATLSLFKEPHSDPKSEALPAIWDNWPDFVAKNDAYEMAVGALDATSQTGLQQTMPKLGATCLSCHQDYRLRKK